jgi:broad specificity phosphatase PhoE
MGTKLIYFVRHGQTLMNASGVKQGPEGSLSEKGRNQALETAKKFPKQRGRAQIVLASPYPRAKETAEIIAKELSLPIEYSDLLVERKNPSEVIGRPVDDLEVRNIVDRIENSFHDDNWRYSDEENFLDLRERCRKLVAYIKSRPENKIIVVTHRAFLKIVLAYMLRGETLTASELNKISFFNQLDNAGISLIQYVPHFLRKGEWKLLVFNDNLIQEEKKKN